ncbi:MAG: hypothetical protein D6748_03205 [Calditrichaeota bacterium]|nr:MAG: hypothetical protein D6748_03205 [Calditrichota bacterium]
MATTYTELIIKAPFLLVKGLLLGFMYGRGEEFPYFFHRKTGIRRETVGEIVRELLVLDTHTFLCLPDAVVDEFAEVVKKAEPVVQCKVVGQRKIAGAEFSFSFECLTQKTANKCKKLLGDLPEGVELVDFNPVEEKHKRRGTIGGYAPAPAYLYKGHGVARGDFGGVIDLYLRIKRSDISDFILCSDVKLKFADQKK